MNIREQFLSHLSDGFNQMSNLLLQQMDLVHNQLFESNDTVANTKIIAENEKTIDHLQNVLRDEMIKTIVLQNPKAGDLRRIMSWYDAVIDIERIADLVENINKRFMILSKQKSILPIFLDDTRSLYTHAEEMIRNVMFAFEREDADIAYGVISADDKLDFLHKTCTIRLFTEKISTDEYPNLKSDILDMGRIYYGIERIGDEASNIAESVVFAVKGENINHTDFQKDK